MRLIGTIEGERHAGLFSDYLFVRGIENQVEPEGNVFEVWVLADEQMAEAADLLQTFKANPAAPEYAKAPETARKKQAQLEEEAEAASKRSFNSRQVLHRDGGSSMPFVTFFLFVVTGVVAVMTQLGSDAGMVQPWVITKYEVLKDNYVSMIQWNRGLQEIRQGEVWRLVTPIFVHFGPVHLIFNMLNLLILGGMVERAMGSRYVIVFVLVCAVLSNLAEYSIRLPVLSTGAPSFGGMSGIVYALFGFAWMKSKYDFGAGIIVHPNTVAMMVVWYVICLFGIIPVANMVHTVGLLMGIVWGYMSARYNTRRG